MRNLKRVLSLTLASVMLLGMMVIGSSAATDYPDVDYDNDNVEAIEVLEAINVMTGYPEDGTFKPGNEVSRAEMARIMAALMDLEYDYYVGANPFTDMAGHWAEGYAAACAANGIIAGRTTTTYDPSATVTAVEAAAMLMRALGYFQNREVDYADGFEISTVRQAGRINLFDRVDVKTNEPMTRNDVAQLILNTLQSGMVEPDKNGTLSVTTPDGFTVATGATNYVYTVARNNTIGQAINDTTATSGNSSSGLTGFILDLGEQLYQGELKLKKNEQDVFGRPSRRWEYKGKEIGTYRKVELLEETYSVKITDKTLYDLLGASTIDDYDMDVYIDGEDDAAFLGNAYFVKTALTRNGDTTRGATGKGVTTEVYVDTERKEITVVVINTYLAKADDDYDEKDDELDLTVYSVNNANRSTTNPIYVKQNNDDGSSEPITVSGEDFDVVDVAKDDILLVQIAQGKIREMWYPEILDSVIIDAFKTNTGSNYVVVDGTQYDHANTARYDEAVLDDYDQSHLKETTYNVILDQYGYLIGLEKNNDPDQYVFLTGIDAGASNLYATTADANVIHLDGTMETVKVDLTKSRNAISGTGSDARLSFPGVNLSQVNTWCKYSVNDKGVYTLKKVNVATATDVRPTTGSPKVAQFAQDVAVYNDYSLTLTGSDEDDIKAISEKRVSLVAFDEDYDDPQTESDLYDATSGAGNNVTFVYGNDDTVYLNVTLDAVQVDDGANANDRNRWIIDDVDSVTVGVKNVNIEVPDLGASRAPTRDPSTQYFYPDYEIYTLYNDKGIVIAALTIGRDNGSSSTLAYISGPVDREEYGHTSNAKAVEGKWTWFRNAIVDGEEVRLTQTGDANTMDLDRLVQGEWYEIRYDANGDVRRSEPIGLADSRSDYVYGAASGYKYIDTTITLELAMSQNTTVLLHDQTTVDQLTFRNGTLYTSTADTKGFHVSADVKVVVANANKTGTTEFNSVTDGYVGYNGVTSAIRDMNCRGTAPDGSPRCGNTDGSFIELSAILVNGAATVIVINDKSPETAGNGITAAAGKITSRPQVQISEGNGTLDIHVPIIDYTSDAANATAVNNAVTSALAQKGYLPIFNLPSNLSESTSGTSDPAGSFYAWGTASATTGAVVTVTYTNYYTLSTNNGSTTTVIEYAPSGRTSGFLTQIGEITGAGTGYYIGSTLAGAPTDYSTSSSKVSSSTVTGNVVIQTNVVNIDKNTPASTPSVTASAADQAASTTISASGLSVNGGTKYARAGSDITIDITLTPNQETVSAYDVYVTYTEKEKGATTATAKTLPIQSLELGADSATSFEFTISKVKGDIDDIVIVVTEHVEPHVLKVLFGGTDATKTVDGVTATINPSVRNNVKMGDVIPVTITLHWDGGAMPGDDFDLVCEGTEGASWNSRSGTDASVTVSDDENIVVTADGPTAGDITLYLNVVSQEPTSAEELITIEFDQNP